MSSTELTTIPPEAPKTVEHWVPICEAFADAHIVTLHSAKGGDLLYRSKADPVKVLEWRKIRYLPGIGIQDITPQQEED